MSMDAELRYCPDCENEQHLIPLAVVLVETDQADITWEKWECPVCLYFEWEEIEEADGNTFMFPLD